MNRKPIIVLCEGNSEYAYVQCLNGLMHEIDAPCTFAPKNVGFGSFRQMKSAHGKERKQNPRTRIVALLDHDIYARNERARHDGYQKFKFRNDFKFNRQNFEDFLALHLDDEKLRKWEDVCRAQDHFRTPMLAKDYMPLVRAHLFPGYQKGEIPFELDNAALQNLFRHNADPTVPFKSDFAAFLLEENIFSRDFFNS